MLRSGLMLSIISLLISTISFANQLVLATVFGSSLQMTAYLLGYSVPAVFTGVLTLLFSFSVVPALINLKQRSSSYPRLLGAFAVITAIGAAVLSMTGLLLAGNVVRRMGGSISSEVAAEAVVICRIFWINAGMSALAALLMAFHNVERRYVVPLLSSGFPYVGMVITTALLGKSWGSEATALGMLSGTTVAVAWLLMPIRRQIELRRITENLHAVVGFLRESPLVLLAMIAFCAGPATEAFWAMRLTPVDITYLGYSQRLVIVLSALVAFGPSAVLMTKLSELSAQGETFEFRNLASRALRMSLFITTPLALMVGMFAAPIVRVVFQRGAFDTSTTVGVASVLPLAMLGGTALCASVIMMKALFANRQPWLAASMGAFQAIAYFVLSGILIRPLGLQGIVIAFAATWWATLLGIVVGLWKKHLPELWRSGRGFTFALLAELITLAVLANIGKRALLPSDIHFGIVDLTLRLGAVCILAALVFVASARYVFRIPEMTQIARAATSRLYSQRMMENANG